jgi:hypothetical protein
MDTRDLEMEQRIKFLDAVEEPPIGSLAVRPFFYVTLRKHPESDGVLPELAARLVLGIDQYERQLGGKGVFYDRGGSVETDTELKIRLIVNYGGWEAFERMDKIHAMLRDLAAKAREPEVAEQDADLRDRVAALVDAPIPRSVAERLELTTG